jgi:hypothetical protein
MRILNLENDPLAVDVQFSEFAFRVVLNDGRELTVPLAWFPRLLNGSPEQRTRWKLIGAGEGIHWPDLDEDISVAGLLSGRGDQTRSRRPAA